MTWHTCWTHIVALALVAATVLLLDHPAATLLAIAGVAVSLGHVLGRNLSAN